MQRREQERISRIQQGLEGNLQPPFKIDLELHRRCNQSCLMCYRQGEPYSDLNSFSKSKELPTDFWLGIIEEGRRLGVKEWHLAGGGEPFFLPEKTLRVMKQIKYLGMYGILTTNGTLFKRDHLSQIIDMGWDVVHFSLHGLRETHNYLTNRQNFSRVLESMSKLEDLKKREGSEKPLVNVNTVLTAQNFAELRRLPPLLNSLNCNLWFVEPLIAYSRLGKELALSNAEIRQLNNMLDEIRRRCRQRGIDINFGKTYNNLSQELIAAAREGTMRQLIKQREKNLEIDSELRVPCYQPWTHLAVKLDGTVNFCDVYTDTGLNLRDQSLKELWHSPQFERVRRRMKEGRLPSYCDKCNPSRVTQRERYAHDLKSVKRDRS